MEGSHVAMQPEQETSSRAKRKRKLKTPAQVEALEKFYNEHKYPTEIMKLEFAKKIDLSEKQVSGWFCHRRLKDKKNFLQGEIYTNGKQNLSSSAIHDRISGVKQESCSSTKQVERNLDSKEVESKMYHGYKSSSDVLAYEASNKHLRAGNNHVAEDRSSGSSSASQGSYLQSNEDLYVAQPSRYKLCDDSSILISNKNTVMRSKEHLVPRHSFLQVENDSSAISALKWKLGRHYREDGPLLGFEFDPLPPGSFDSPIRDSKCEPYYVGDSMQHESSSFYRNINELWVNSKNNIEKLATKAYQEERSSKRTKPTFIDCNEITNLPSTQNAISSHVQHQAIAIDETEKSTNQTTCFNGRNNLRCFNYKTEGRYDTKDGYNFHQNSQSSNIKTSFSYPNYDTQAFHGDTKSFVALRKKYDSISSECWHQPQKILKDNIRKQSTRKNHSAFQPKMHIKRSNTARKVNGAELMQQHRTVKGLEKPAHHLPFKRHPSDMESNGQQDVSGGSSSSLD